MNDIIHDSLPDESIKIDANKNVAEISFQTTYGKNAVRKEKNESKVALSTDEVDRRLGRVAGTLIHLVHHRLCLRKFKPELTDSTSQKSTLPIEDFNSGAEFNSSEESQHEIEMMGVSTRAPKINIPEEKIGREVLVEVGNEWVDSLPQALKAHVKKRWEEIGIYASAFVEGIKSHPYFNSENIVIASEVSLPAVTGHLKQVSLIMRGDPIEYKMQTNPRETTKKETIQINVAEVIDNSDYAKNDPERKNIENFLYETLILNVPFVKYFPAMEKKFKEAGVSPDDILLGFNRKEFDLQITDMLKRKQIDKIQMNTIIALRILSQAIHEANFFIGGRIDLSEIRSVQELRSILMDVGSDKAMEKNDDLEKMKNELSKEKIDYREPSGIRPDILMFEMPQNMNSDQRSFIKEFNEFLTGQYEHYSNPPLLINMDFYSLLDRGVALGMKIKTIDLKSSLQNKEEIEMHQYIKELYYYAISMAQGVVAYRKYNNPTERYGIFDLLNDPILRAHQGSEILLSNMVQGEGQDIGAKITQIEDNNGLFNGQNAKGIFRSFYRELQESLKRMVVAGKVKNMTPESGSNNT